MLYLLGEMVILLLLAFVLGLFVSWVLWRWQQDTVSKGDYQKAIDERNHLRRKLEEVRQGKKAATQLVDTKEPLNIVNEPAEDTSLVPLNKSRKDSRDDLTKIEGITPEIEELINGKGISTYREIGSMNDASVESLFKDLAIRPYNLDNKEFLDQARRLYNQKSANQISSS